MKKNYLQSIIGLSFVLLLALFSCRKDNNESISDSLLDNLKVKGHPRLIMTQGEEQLIKAAIKADAKLARLHDLLIEESNRIIGLPLLKREMIGTQILGTSREAIRRINFLAYSYRMTNLSTYSQRAEQELVNVCNFQDWNHAVFLDAAEMALAVSIGYDWLFDQIKPETKTLIEKKLLEFAIIPSENSAYNWWLTTNMNWNQVCNAGITAAAVALYEKDPIKSSFLVNRASNSIKVVTSEFAPDGAYPEGHNYWNYGVGFHVIYLETMLKAFGTDYGNSKSAGFLKTADYYNHLISPTSRTFNYFDSPNWFAGFEPSILWFQEILKDPSVLYNEATNMTNLKPIDIQSSYYRILPFAMLWGSSVSFTNVTTPTKLMYSGGGKNPVAMMRSAWGDRNAIYVGAKGGNAAVSHSHLDAGSFVMESDGVRWSSDLGMSDYVNLEAAKLDIWNLANGSDRWKVFRYINPNHSTVTVNNKLQLADQKADIIKTGEKENFMFTQIDLTNIYKNDLTSLVRGVALINKNIVAIQDKFTAPAKTTLYSWRMVTEATIEDQGTDYLVLGKSGQKLMLKIESSIPINIKTWSTDSPNAYDERNPNTRIVGFEIDVPSGSTQTVTVKLIPWKNKELANSTIQPIEQWQ